MKKHDKPMFTGKLTPWRPQIGELVAFRKAFGTAKDEVFTIKNVSFDKKKCLIGYENKVGNCWLLTRDLVPLPL